jgi:hypothetical protein
MLPLWLAFSASLMLHVAVLVAPGWALPFEDDHAGQTLDATLVVPDAHKEMAVQAALPPPLKPVRKKRPVPVTPPAPDAPVAALPADSAVPPQVGAPQVGAEAGAGTPTEPAAPADSTAGAVPPAPTISPPFPYAGNWPKNGRIVFQVSRGEDGLIVGQSTHRWSHDGASYRLSTLTETTGLAALFRSVSVAQESQGVLSAAGLQPLEFKAVSNGRPKDSMRFDLEQHRITTANGDQIALAGPAQDMLSVFYQLGTLPLDVPQFTLKLMTGRKLVDYAVSVEGPLEIDNILGKRTALHLTVKVPGGGKTDDSTEIWLDTETRLPLKIRHRDRKGEVFDQVATAIELDKPE